MNDQLVLFLLSPPFLLIFISLLSGLIIGAIIGALKSRTGLGLILGMLLGPIGWIIMLFMRTHRHKCFHCGGVVEAGNKTCVNCGSDIPIIKKHNDRNNKGEICLLLKQKFL